MGFLERSRPLCLVVSSVFVAEGKGLTSVVVNTGVDLEVSVDGDSVGHPYVGVDIGAAVNYGRLGEDGIISFLAAVVFKDDGVGGRHCAGGY